jgi:hypothetical protein
MPKRERVSGVHLVLFCLVLIAGSWPWRYLASPEWEVQVIDPYGNPVPGISTRLVYENYSVENRSHEITLKTDERGQAIFSPQHERASAFQWVFFTASSAVAIAHASFGRSAFVLAFGDRYSERYAESDETDWSGHSDTMKSIIVVNRE